MKIKIKINTKDLKGRWRTVLAWAAIIGGALAIFGGWFAVSGETVAAKQLPYLISGGLGGLALVAGGVGLLIADDLRAERARSGRLESEMLEVRDLLQALLEKPGKRAS
jgi:hypothetical protein